MNVLENEIEDLIFDAAKNNPTALYQKGLNLGILYNCPKVLRQFRLGNYGIMDIVMVGYDPDDKEILIHALELKKDAINYDTLNQGIRYLKGIEQYVSRYYPNFNIIPRVSLIGSKIDLTTTFCYVADYMPRVSLFTYGLDFNNGITFKQHSGYCLTNDDFKAPTEPMEDEFKSMIYTQIRRKVNV